MTVSLINPKNFAPLHAKSDCLVDNLGTIYPITNGVARIAELDNYTENFGLQWNMFDKTQLDRDVEGLVFSFKRFFAGSGWSTDELADKDILEVGSGAGRFSRVVLEHTRANLYSVDYSDAVTANFNNNGKIAPDRFHLFQASVYDLPFPDNSFDKVFCFGVLQHTPSFESSVRALIGKAKPGGEVVVDFYPIKGWWTKLHAKYILRPWTKKMSHADLFKIIEGNVDWLVRLATQMRSIGLGALTRFLPLVDLRTIPRSELSDAQFRDWVILDTFDMFSPKYDNPQRVKDVAAMFGENGARVTFAGFINYAGGFRAAVVRGTKLP
jgi:SAM-dependent methyltransferase